MKRAITDADLRHLPELLKINHVYGNSGHPGRLAMAQEILSLRAAVRAVIGFLGEHEGGSWDDPVAGPIQQALDQLRAALPEAEEVERGSV